MAKNKKNVNNVKPCSTTELIETAWILFLSSIKTKHYNYNYSLRPVSNYKI